MSITTKMGDAGKTQLYSGTTVSKASPRTEALGDLDELVSALGLARCHQSRDGVRASILALQRTLFLAGSEVALEPAECGRLAARIDEAAVKAVDRHCAALEQRIRMPGDFIVPGTVPAAAFLDHARSVARRCERRIVGLADTGLLDNPNLFAWFNRLSDLLWLMARAEEGQSTPLRAAARKPDAERG